MEDQPHLSFSQMVGKTVQPEQPQVVPVLWWVGRDLSEAWNARTWPKEYCAGWFAAQASRSVWTTLSVTCCDSRGGAVQSQGLDLVILVCPFQSRAF